MKTIFNMLKILEKYLKMLQILDLHFKNMMKIMESSLELHSISIIIQDLCKLLLNKSSAIMKKVKINSQELMIDLLINNLLNLYQP